MPSFSKFINGIVHAVSTDESGGHSRYGSRSSPSVNAYGEIDEYHTTKCNKVNPNANIRISLCIESPPIMLYGKPADSSGALFNGAVVLDVFPKNSKDIREMLESRTGVAGNSVPVSPTFSMATSNGLGPTASVSQLSQEQLRTDYVELRQVKLYFLQVVRYSKPFLPHSSTIQHCSRCCHKVTELASWDVLTRRTAFAKGTSHSFPFGYLIPGKVPPTTTLSLHGTSITYELVCKATFVNRHGVEDLINLSLPVMIRRSIFRGHDHSSLRIFPPTDVTATAAIPNISYPRSTFPVEIRMDNIATKERRWRLRKLSWKIEESVRVRAHYCEQHEHKFETALEVARKKLKGRKLNRNSKGVSGPAYNYFIGDFEQALIPNGERRHDSGTSSSNSSANSISSISSSLLAERRDYGAGDSPSHTQVADTTSAVQNESTGNLASVSSAEYASVSALQSPDTGGGASGTTAGTGALGQSSSRAVSNSVSASASATRGSTPALSPFATNWSLEASSSHVPQSSNEVPQIVANIDEVVVPEKKDSLYTEEIRQLSSGEMKSGWKSDFSNKGRIELVVDISVMNLMSMGFNSANTNITTITSENCDSPLFDPATYLEADSNCSCDISDPELGIYVNHNLIVEAIVAEELVQNSSSLRSRGNSSSSSSSFQSQPARNANHEVSPHTHGPELAGTSNSATDSSSVHDGGTGPDSMHGNRYDYANQTSGIPTGVARVLRMQFKVVLTERSGLGVSWDDEVPPTYNAVHTLSPPSYEEATSNNTTPLLSSLVIPLDHIGSFSPNLDSTNMDLSNPEIPRHARVRTHNQQVNDSNNILHLQSTLSHLDLNS
mgnify:CR=1 FL=1